MNTYKSSGEGVRVAALVALGLEFSCSHGVEYALNLIEQLGADERTLELLREQFTRQRKLSATAQTEGS